MRLKVINHEIHPFINHARRHDWKTHTPSTHTNTHSSINIWMMDEHMLIWFFPRSAWSTVLKSASPPALFPSLSWFWREILNDHSAAVLHAARNHCSARSLILSVREEWRGPADTQHPAILRSPSQTHTFTSTQINIRTGDRRQTDKRGVERNTHAERATRLAGDGQWTWAWGLLGWKGEQFHAQVHQRRVHWEHEQTFFHPDRLQQLPSPL